MSTLEHLLEALRAICLGLPEVSEKLSHGEPTWFVRGKTFVMFSNHHHRGPLGFWCAAPPGAQEGLIDADPDRFFRPPYVGHRGWIGVDLEGEVDWEEMAGIVHEAYRCIAPPRLAAMIAG